MVLIVLDSVGVGELPDAGEYGDKGTNTLGHIAHSLGGLFMPHLKSFGLGNIESVQGISPIASPLAYYGKMSEISKGKDTTTGHWEIMGIHTETPFHTYPEGFPAPLIREFEKLTGRKVIGNKVASGTEIITELGEEHLRTGSLIVYTSADSVFQIAAHEEVVPLDELYHVCEVARELTMQEEFLVVRVIARPFVGQPDQFTRTPNRRDFSIAPPSLTVLNSLKAQNYDVIGIGKISDIYAGEGITRSISSKSNMDGVDKLIQVLKEPYIGLAFVNLVDFDAQYGHRRDVKGYGRALEEFDQRVPEIIDALQHDDLLIITADHGNDPTHHGTDHTREYVPLLVFSKSLNKSGESLGIRNTFADIGAAIAANFDVEPPHIGTSFLDDVT